MSADPIVTDDPERERFLITVGDEQAGFLEYRVAGRRIALTHTEIDPRFEGRGLGAILVAAALDAIRERELEVVPLCPFVARYIAQHDEYRDLVLAALRSRLL